MKKTTLNIALKALLLFLLSTLCLTSKAVTYDFIDNTLYYKILSNNTVAVSGIEHWYYYEEPYNSMFAVHDVEIPSHVTHNNEEYVVTAIADSAFYGVYFINQLTIPETIASIGTAAFKNFSNETRIKCMAEVPPVLNDSFGELFVLLVHEESYDLYKDAYDSYDYFDYILSYDGTPSTIPTCEVYDYGMSYTTSAILGSIIIYDNCEENTVIYEQVGLYIGSIEDSESILEWHAWSGWHINSENITVIGGEFMHIHHYFVNAFAIVDDRYYVNIDVLMAYNAYSVNAGGAWDFGYDGFIYSFIDYYDIHKVRVSYPENIGEEYNVYCYYHGDIVIPSSAHFAIWDYEVVEIGPYVFLNGEEINSVTMPATIKYIDYHSFSNCPNLSEITCLGTEPPSTYDVGFSEQNYQTVTLRVPQSAVDAYRNSPVWCNFQNIVGFYDYDFELDGLYYKKMGDGTVVITAGPNNYSGNVTVPTEVIYDGVTYTVSGIANGAFANAELTNLYIPVTIGSVGENAFADCQVQSLYITGSGAWSAGGLGLHVDNLYIESGVSGLAGIQVDASVIYCYAVLPPVCDDGTFLSYDAELHVPASSLAAYFTASYWCNFLNISSDAVAVTEFTLSANSLDLLVGGQVTLTATIKPANATPATITWSSSDEAVATVVNGVVNGVSAGSCDIVAVCQNERAVCHVVVTEILPTGISLNLDNAKIEVGSQLTLTASIQPNDATMTTVTWSTDNPAVATVTDGVVTAVGPGECEITATCGECQALCHIIVVEHLIYITLDEHEASLLPNHIIILTPTVTPVATELVVTSSNPSVAAARMANGLVQVVGISEGEAMITLRSSDGYAEPDSCLVTVYTEKGDVNCDGYIDINDVTTLIDRVLGNPSDISIKNADVNHDGFIDINDVTILINYVLKGIWPEEPTQPTTEVFTVNGVSFTMVEVQGGTFGMGATVETDSNASEIEAPIHDVTLSTYCIGQTEVTQELWQAVMGSNPSHFTGDLQLPVEQVNYEDCQAFIAALNNLTGENFRLPTEAEWEFAARGGNNSHHYMYSGSDDITQVACYKTNSGSTTHAVATKQANELGIYDMSGNVCEWVHDWVGMYPAEPQTNPTGPESAMSRVHRGGGYQSLEKNCAVTRRNYFSPGIVRNYMGLRLAK